MSTWLLLPLKWLLYCLSFLMPKSKNIWLFGSRNGQFVDNPKYFFLHLIKHQPDITAVWVTDDAKTLNYLESKSLPVVKKWSFKGIILSLRAKIFIYAFDSNDVNFFCSGNTKLVNLYHGIPLKKIEFDTTVGTSKKVYHPQGLWQIIRSKIIYAPKWQKIDLFQIPNEALKKIHNQAFNNLITEYFVGINPRLAPITDQKGFHDIVEQEMSYGDDFVAGFDKVWIYMPTWRVGAPDIVADAFPDLEQLNNTLKAQNVLLILKMHLYSTSSINSCSHIKVFPPEWDIYPFLNKTDLLITDYSSIAFDYALVNKPVVFYSYDLKEYLESSSEGFYFDYEKLADNKAINTFDEFIQMINLPEHSKFILNNTMKESIWQKELPKTVFENNQSLVDSINQILEAK